MSRENTDDETPTNSSIEQDAEEERRLDEIFRNTNFVADSPRLVCPRRSKFTAEGIVSTPCDLGERHLKADLTLPDLKQRTSMSSTKDLYALSQKLAVTTPRRAKSMEDVEQPEEIAVSEMEDTPHVQAQERKVKSQQPEDFSDQEMVPATREGQPNQALWKSQSLPALWKSPSVAVLSNPQAVPVPKQSQAVPVPKQSQALQVVRKRQALQVVRKRQSLEIVPVVMHRRTFQALMPRQGVPLAMQRKDVLALMQLQAVPRSMIRARPPNYFMYSTKKYRWQRKNYKKNKKIEPKAKSGHVIKRIVSSNTFHWFVAIAMVTLLNLYIIREVVKADITFRNENNVCNFNDQHLIIQYLIWFGSLFN